MSHVNSYVIKGESQVTNCQQLIKMSMAPEEKQEPQAGTCINQRGYNYLLVNLYSDVLFNVTLVVQICEKLGLFRDIPCYFSVSVYNCWCGHSISQPVYLSFKMKASSLICSTCTPTAICRYH